MVGLRILFAVRSKQEIEREKKKQTREKIRNCERVWLLAVNYTTIFFSFNFKHICTENKSVLGNDVLNVHCQTVSELFSPVIFRQPE